MVGREGWWGWPMHFLVRELFDRQHSPAAEPVVTLGEAPGWGLSSVSSEVVMHRVSALGASQGVF